MFRPILNKLGFDKLQLVLSGGAPLPADTMALWHMFGVNVCEMYGQTETAGAIISGQRGPFPRPGDVGTVPDGWQIEFGKDNEILVHGKDLFEGYWQNDEATKSVLQDDGWLKTGDVGEMRDGQLRLIDRARDFIVTSGGKTISPAYIENILRASPFIAEAVVSVQRALIAETSDLIAVHSGLGSARRPSELARVEGLGTDGDYRVTPANAPASRSDDRAASLIPTSLEGEHL